MSEHLSKCIKEQYDVAMPFEGSYPYGILMRNGDIMRSQYNEIQRLQQELAEKDKRIAHRDSEIAAKDVRISELTQVGVIQRQMNEELRHKIWQLESCVPVPRDVYDDVCFFIIQRPPSYAVWASSIFESVKKFLSAGEAK